MTVPANRFLAAMAALSLALAGLASAQAEDWPQWRGPHQNGSSNDTGLVDHLDKDTTLWSTPLPGGSSATPVICGGRVFVSSLSPEKDLLAICIDAGTGKVLWQKTVGKDRQAANNDMASPSPITDGKSAWFYYGTGDLAAFDIDGKKLWARNIEKDFGNLSVKYGYSSSPLLFGGKLYVPVLRRPTPYNSDPPADKPLDSFLLAVDPQTGKDIWRQVRPSDAVDEAFETYSSPTVRQGKDRTEIILFGGDYVSAHDPQTGKEFWRFGFNAKKQRFYRTVPTPTASEDLIYAYIPRKSGPAFAVKTGGSGLVGPEFRAWDTAVTSPDVSCWLLYQNVPYMLDGEKKILYRIDPKTGKAVWQGSVAKAGDKPAGKFTEKKIPGGEAVFRASPTGADGKIYLIDEKGTATVLAAGDEFKIISRTPLGEGPCRASVAVADGKIYVRTAKAIYCFGKQGAR